MKRIIIKTIIVVLICVVLVALVLFILLKDKIQAPYVSFILTRLVNVYEARKITKIDRINKIEVTLKGEKYEFTDKEDINKIVSLLKNVEGYRTGSSLVYLLEDIYHITIYFDDDNLVKLSISPMNFWIRKKKGSDTKFYKNKENYYILMENLMTELTGVN